jgi:hypothetical protein
VALQFCTSAISIAVLILMATIAPSSCGTTERPAAEGQMSLELSCHRTPPGSGVTFTVTIRNGMPEPASVVVAYVRGNGVEYLAPGLTFRLKRFGSFDPESFQYRAQGDRSGGGTGRLDGRLVLLAAGASFEWSIDGLHLVSLGTRKRFDASLERGELHVVFNSGPNKPGGVPKLWNGRLESNIVQFPEECKDGG